LLRCTTDTSRCAAPSSSRVPINHARGARASTAPRFSAKRSACLVRAANGQTHSARACRERTNAPPPRAARVAERTPHGDAASVKPNRPQKRDRIHARRAHRSSTRRPRPRASRVSFPEPRNALTRGAPAPPDVRPLACAPRAWSARARQDHQRASCVDDPRRPETSTRAAPDPSRRLVLPHARRACVSRALQARIRPRAPLARNGKLHKFWRDHERSHL